MRTKGYFFLNVVIDTHANSFNKKIDFYLIKVAEM